MRYSRIRALMPALVLVLALATALRADCANELALDWTSGTAVLIGSEERTQEVYFPIPVGTMAHVVVKLTLVTEVGTYLMPDGSRVRILCDERLELR